MNESQYKVLDDILKCFSDFDRPDNYFESWKILVKIRERGININTQPYKPERIRTAINKLVNESYLDKMPLCLGDKESDIHDETLDKQYYRLTFEGELLINDGGYVKKIQNENLDLVLTKRLAYAIAVGTVFGGIFGLIECIKVLWKFFNWICKYNC